MPWTETGRRDYARRGGWDATDPTDRKRRLIAPVRAHR